jgi:hypothetical protein
MMRVKNNHKWPLGRHGFYQGGCSQNFHYSLEMVSQHRQAYFRTDIF